MSEPQSPQLRYYVLDDEHRVIPCDLHQWAQWFGTSRRCIARDEIGGYEINTVFIGVQDMLFETMIFGGSLNQMEWICSTWDEAIRQHAEAVRAATVGQANGTR
jgi:hypothetical protein